MLLGARPPASSPERSTGSSQSVDPKIRQEMLDAVNRSIEAGFRAQDAYQIELQKQSTMDASPGSPRPTPTNGAGVRLDGGTKA